MTLLGRRYRNRRTMTVSGNGMTMTVSGRRYRNRRTMMVSERRHQRQEARMRSETLTRTLSTHGTTYRRG